MTASNLELLRTKATGSWPEAINSLRVCPPVKPVAPVIATRMFLNYCKATSQCNLEIKSQRSYKPMRCASNSRW